MEAGLYPHFSPRPETPCASVSLIKLYEAPGRKWASDRHYCSHRCKRPAPSEPGPGVLGARETKPQGTGPTCDSLAESPKGRGAGTSGRRLRQGALSRRNQEKPRTATRRRPDGDAGSDGSSGGDRGTVAKGTMGGSDAGGPGRPPQGAGPACRFLRPEPLRTLPSPPARLPPPSHF